VLYTLYGAPGCDDLKVACGLSPSANHELDGCIDFNLADGTISAYVNCTNHLTNFYEGEGCSGSPYSTAIDVPSGQCATTRNWYFTIVYDEAVCSAGSRMSSSFWSAAALF
jgi:hypothetical protein